MYDHKMIEDFWRRTIALKKHNTEERTGRKFYIFNALPKVSEKLNDAETFFRIIFSDVVSRFQSMNGRKTHNPIGLETFGEDIENKAKLLGKKENNVAALNAARFEDNLDKLGIDIGTRSRILTSDPRHHKWTQELFKHLFYSFYDSEHQWTDIHGEKRKGCARNISFLHIPEHIKVKGKHAICFYKDKHRLIYEKK